MRSRTFHSLDGGRDAADVRFFRRKGRRYGRLRLGQGDPGVRRLQSATVISAVPAHTNVIPAKRKTFPAFIGQISYTQK